MSPSRLLAILALLVAPPALADPPTWTVDPAGYEQSMGTTSVVSFGGAPSTGADDRLAAFLDGEVRGVAIPLMFNGRNLFALTVYGGAADAGRPLTFRAYNAATDAVRDVAMQSDRGEPVALTFGSNQQYGSPGAPYRAEAAGGVRGPGWVAPDPAAYEGSATVNGVPVRSGVDLADDGVRVAAFVGGVLRGVAGPTSVVNGRRRVFLQVVGSAADAGAEITFQVYVPGPTAAGDQVYDVPASEPFEVNASFGTASQPHEWVTAPGPVLRTQLDGPAGWRMLGAPTAAAPLAELLGPLWTQGAVGADVGHGDPTVYGYDEAATCPPGAAGCGANVGFAPLTDLTGPAGAGRGYFAYTFEDDDPVRPGVQGGFPKRLAVTGPEPAAPFPFPVSFTPTGDASSDGWNLLANPFTTAIRWNQADWVRTNVGATVYVWDPSAGRNLFWNAALNSGDLSNGVIPAFSGFWAQSTATSPILRVAASARVVPAPPSAPRAHSTADPLVLTFAATAGPLAGRTAPVYVVLHPDATAGVDALDSFAPPPFSAAHLRASTQPAGGGADLVLQALPALRTTVDLPLRLEAHGADHAGTAYEVSLTAGTAWSGWTAEVVDRADGRVVPLTTGGPVPLAGPLASAAATPRFALRLTPATSTSEEDAAPATAELDPPRPNPTTLATVVGYRLRRTEAARLTLHDVLGREMAVLAEGLHLEGPHTALLDASRLAPGVYLLRLEANAPPVVRRLTVVR